MNAATLTRWPVVAAAFGAGVIGAAHIGKMPAALPAIRAEFALDLIAAGWIVSAFSATGMILGMMVGLASDRLGHHRVAVTGMILMAAGSVFGALTTSGAMMLMSRFLEGLGFLIAVISAPSIIAEATAPEDRRLAIGMWGAFMPTGMGALLVLSPFLLGWAGWRGSWLVLAAVTLAWAMVMGVIFRNDSHSDEDDTVPEHPWRNMVITITARGPWLLALCFGFYTTAWLALMVWLPTFLIEERGLPVATAALMTMVAVIINLPGNLMGGWLLHKRVARGLLIGIAGLAIILAGPLVFLDILPDGARYTVCLLYSMIVGLLPAGIFSGAPHFSPTPRQIGTTNGLIVQGSHLGQFAGPPVVAATVALLGSWQAGAWVFVACGVGVIVFAILIGLEENRVNRAVQGNSDSM